MFRSMFISGTAMLVCWTPLHAQSAQPSSLPVGTTIRVILQKPLDSRKNNAGDLVIAKSTEKRMSNTNEILPKGAKIIGHLTKVRSHTKEEPESLLSIVFDRAILKDNREIPVRLIIQAVAPSQKTTIPTMSMTPATAAGTSGGMGPVTGPLTAGPMSDPNADTPGRVASPEATTQSPADNMSTRGELTPSCRGVLHIEGLALAPENPILGSIIVTRNRNIQLDIGTQMMLRVPED